jgi:predicted N-acetyltransferase YhbS
MNGTDMPSLTFSLRSAREADLDAINRVIEAAVMIWKLPDRVKRLSLSSYRYTPLDFKHLEMRVAEDARQSVVGVAAWEQADAKDIPAGQTALLLQGLYVDPSHHHQGIGRQLFRTAKQAAQKHPYSGLLVKAQKDANGFFISQGMSRLQIEDPLRHYGNRFFLSNEYNRSGICPAVWLCRQSS